jgi:mannose-1-phosphate guanylyltransferase/mannose-6-phosphate isomerase
MSTPEQLPVFPVLLAGGSGSRLWPVSRELHPKQIAKFIGKESLIQSTLRRLVPPFAAENVRVVCGEPHLHEIGRHMEDIGIAPAGRIITEPVGRNTAPAILLAVTRILESTADAIIGVFPADHVIGDLAGFHSQLAAAVGLAARGRIVTFGITPLYPETGYGYVEGAAAVPGGGGALAIRRFVEKPDLETAHRYIEAGNFFWNSGMFAFRASVILEEFRRHQPRMLAALRRICAPGRVPSREDYQILPDVSIDVAVMEKTLQGVVLPSEFGWSDIGSWKSLYDFLPKDPDGNVFDGDVIAQDTRNCFILGYERLIAANRLQNLVVVETPDSIFVSDIAHSRDVKSIVNELKQKGRAEYHQHLTIQYAWGERSRLEDQDGHCVHRFMVYPGAQTTLTAAPGVTAHLFVLGGRALIRNGRRRRRLGPGGSYTAPAGGDVCVENIGAERLYGIHVDLANGAGEPGAAKR